MVLATVPAAPPARKKHRATSWPAPISANVPYLLASTLICSAFWFVSGLPVAITPFQYTPPLFANDKFVIASHPVRQQKSRAVVFALSATAAIHDERVAVPFHHGSFIGRQQGQRFTSP